MSHAQTSRMNLPAWLIKESRRARVTGKKAPAAARAAKPNPRSGLVYEGIELCRKEGIDFVLAVGGGSVIDSSKAIAALLLTMVHEGPRVIADPNNYEARANIMWAGMMAHNNSCGVGRSQDWNSHNIEHELSATYDCAHGAKEEDIPQMVRVLCRGGGRGGSISGFVTLDEEDCEKIYRMMV